jgi:hypothetical protein
LEKTSNLVSNAEIGFRGYITASLDYGTCEIAPNRPSRITQRMRDI